MKQIDLFIVGVDHSIQFGVCSKFREPDNILRSFSDFIKKKCLSLSIKVIAEEISSDARLQNGITQTVPESVVNDLGLVYIECDPDEKERSQLGILNCGLVKAHGLLNGDPEHVVQANIRKEFDKREDEWLHRIFQSEVFPVLLICGYAHSSRFLNKAIKRGLSAKVLTKNWSTCD